MIEYKDISNATIAKSTSLIALRPKFFETVFFITLKLAFFLGDYSAFLLRISFFSVCVGCTLRVA